MDITTLARAKRIESDIAELDYQIERSSKLRNPTSDAAEELFEQFVKDATLAMQKTRQRLWDELASL